MPQRRRIFWNPPIGGDFFRSLGTFLSLLPLVLGRRCDERRDNNAEYEGRSAGHDGSWGIIYFMGVSVGPKPAVTRRLQSAAIFHGIACRVYRCTIRPRRAAADGDVSRTVGLLGATTPGLGI